MKKWIIYIIICAMIFTFVPNVATTAAGVTWKKPVSSKCILDKVFRLNLDTDAVIYGYYKGKVALMDGYTGKLIKTTGFTEINEVRKIENNTDAIVGKEVKGKLFFGLINKSGNTLIQADKYTQIYYMSHGFRAVDAKKKSYFITRTGKVLYTYGNGETIKEYCKYFVVIKPTYPKDSDKNTEPSSAEIKGIYDYTGKKFAEISEADKTANNQYWMLYNSVITNIKKSVENEMKEMIPQEYTEQVKVYINVSSKGNCYIVRASAYAQDTNKNYYIKGNSYLYDIKGNLLEKPDELWTVDDTYVVCRSYAVGGNNTVASATLYDTKTYQKTENADMKSGNVWKFGDYFLTGSPDDNFITEPIMYDATGKLFKKFNGLGSIKGDYLVINNNSSDSPDFNKKTLYNKKMEEVQVDGIIYYAGDGYIICNRMSDNKVKWKFTDMSLNIVAEAVFKDHPGEYIQFKILKNKTGVYLMNSNSNNGFSEYVIDKGGKIIYTYSDGKYDTNVFVKSRGTTNYISCIKMDEYIKAGIVSLTCVKNSGNGEASVTWKPLKGVTGYQIEYKNTAQTYVQNVKTKGASISLTGLEKGKTYSIRVRAYIFDGKYQIGGKYGSPKSVKIVK